MKFSAFIAAILLTVSFIACGGESEEAQPMDSAATAEPAAEPAPAPTMGDSGMTADSAMGSDSAK